MAELESERLAALSELAILDTEPEEAFDGLVRLASRIAGVPTALVSLLDGERQWFKARVGLDVCSTGRDVAFCEHVVQAEQELEVPDARRDPRFAGNPLVTGHPHIVFYAGFPLALHNGLIVGTLCVIGYEPQVLDDEQRDGLRVLARQAGTRLDLRRRTAEQADTSEIFERRAGRVPGLSVRHRRAYRRVDLLLTGQAPTGLDQRSTHLPGPRRRGKVGSPAGPERAEGSEHPRARPRRRGGAADPVPRAADRRKMAVALAPHHSFSPRSHRQGVAGPEHQQGRHRPCPDGACPHPGGAARPPHGSAKQAPAQ